MRMHLNDVLRICVAAREESCTVDAQTNHPIFFIYVMHHTYNAHNNISDTYGDMLYIFFWFNQ